MTIFVITIFVITIFVITIFVFTVVLIFSTVVFVLCTAGGPAGSITGPQDCHAQVVFITDIKIFLPVPHAHQFSNSE